VKSLRDIEGEPLLEMHADDAGRVASSTGRWCDVFNRPGQLPLQVPTSATVPGRVSSTAWASGGASSGWKAPTSTSSRTSD
jgi:hypothetical protein